MSVRTRVAKKRFKKYNPLFIGFVKQQLLPRKELFYISSSFDKIRCEIEDIINEHMKKLSNVIPDYGISNLITRYKNLVAEMTTMSILSSIYIVWKRDHSSPIDHRGLQAGIYESKRRFFVDGDN